MKRAILSAAAAALLTWPAMAEEAKTDAQSNAQQPAATQIDKAGTEATKEVGKAVPEMTNPDKHAQPPTKAVGEAVPPMTPDAKSASPADEAAMPGAGAEKADMEKPATKKTE